MSCQSKATIKVRQWLDHKYKHTRHYYGWLEEKIIKTTINKNQNNTATTNNHNSNHENNKNDNNNDNNNKKWLIAIWNERR